MSSLTSVTSSSSSSLNSSQPFEINKELEMVVSQPDMLTEIMKKIPEDKQLTSMLSCRLVCRKFKKALNKVIKRQWVEIGVKTNASKSLNINILLKGIFNSIDQLDVSYLKKFKKLEKEIGKYDVNKHIEEFNSEQTKIEARELDYCGFASSTLKILDQRNESSKGSSTFSLIAETILSKFNDPENINAPQDMLVRCHRSITRLRYGGYPQRVCHVYKEVPKSPLGKLVRLVEQNIDSPELSSLINDYIMQLPESDRNLIYYHNWETNMQDDSRFSSSSSSSSQDPDWGKNHIAHFKTPMMSYANSPTCYAKDAIPAFIKAEADKILKECPKSVDNELLEQLKSGDLTIVADALTEIKSQLNKA